MITDHLFEGADETCRLYRSIDWSRTGLGAAAAWPTSLRTIVRVVLQSKFPMALWWGRDRLTIYNEAYRPILGAKHPAAAGAPGAQVWAEIWHILGPQADSILEGQPATWNEHLLLPMNRKGYLEETYFTFSYSPVPDDSGAVGGVLITCQETTRHVQNERQLHTLRDLAPRSIEAKTAEEVCSASARVLGENDADVPFALLYLTSPDGSEATLVQTVGLPREGGPAAPARIPLDGPGAEQAIWPLAEATRAGAQVVVRDLRRRVGDLPGGRWKVPPEVAVCLPLAGSAHGPPQGFLVAGTSPLRALDEAYAGFFGLASEHVAAGIVNARAYQEERRRAESLAEIDRARTAFFNNVSHELRTPLTLILGPTEDALRSPAQTLGGESLRAVHRNASRLLKIVNALLDFARIEAGRAQATYRPTDLAELTRDLASAFRSAFERAGLRFEVDCPALPEEVFVDHDMWEKVVLNLLSNALKFTLSGGVRIALGWRGEGATLSVSDTGTGIPADELPRTLERFHRVQGATSRTHEGSGIGLALVQEIVHLHGGTIGIQSREGHGTTFTVEIPRGFAHLPAEQVDRAAPSTGTVHGAVPFVEEAFRWLPEPGAGAAAGADPAPASGPQSAPRSVDRSRILLVDDNADMRDYLARLLRERWTVETAVDGANALSAARESPPDLVVTDVMMPGLDGFGLLRELRADPRTRDVPVVALSARAGEEARIGGLQAGFHDYVVKPFTARELVARVDAQLARAKVRAANDAHRRRLASIFESAPVGICVLRGKDHVYELANPDYVRLVSRRPLIGRTVREAFPELAGQGIYELLDRVFATGEPYVAKSRPVTLDQGGGVLEERFVDLLYQPLREHDGRVGGIVVVAFDVTDLAVARRQAEAANRTKDEFLAMLGHELRNPLAPIVTALHLMRLRSGSVAEKERAVIGRQVEHLTRLVDDLLDVSRIARGKIELRRARVELSEVVARAIETTSTLVEQRRHALSVRVPERGLTLDGDPARLAQIVSNLLGNAAKYTNPNGHIAVTAERQGDQVELRIRDDGIGMAPDMLPRIFDLFEQDQQSLDRSQGGLGLGLAIVKSLVQLHGGSVTAHSEGKGRGSELVLRLPLALPLGEPATSSVAPPPPDARPRPDGGGRILVVDDNEDAAELLAEMLADEGYEVRIAGDGAAALRLADETAPRLLLIDIGLPVMDGYEVARRLRANPAHRHARLVAITGYGQESDRRRSREAGFDAHLVKPVNMEALLALAREATEASGDAEPRSAAEP